VVMDVVKRYDIDGVQFDDYFYPDPTINANRDFPDEASWKKYGASGKLNRAKETLASAIRLVREMGTMYRGHFALEVSSRLAAARGDGQAAALMHGASDAAVDKMGGMRVFDDPISSRCRLVRPSSSEPTHTPQAPRCRSKSRPTRRFAGSTRRPCCDGTLEKAR